jgi:hypothetical protein
VKTWRPVHLFGLGRRKGYAHSRARVANPVCVPRDPRQGKTVYVCRAPFGAEAGRQKFDYFLGEAPREPRFAVREHASNWQWVF